MSYFDGFVIAVPKDNKQKFVDHAATIDPIFMELGAIRVVECWQDDVPEGKTTDFYKAVKAEKDEVTVFSFIEWPDKATRDAAMKKMEEMMSEPDPDPRFNMENTPMPFDGKRMIMGGFEEVFALQK